VNNLLDQALGDLAEANGAELSREQITDASAAVGRLVSIIEKLIRESEAAHNPFFRFVAEHPELRPLWRSCR
jgi:hypothetical protein